MKKNILLLLLMLLFVACETGTKYDRDEITAQHTTLSKEPKSGLVERHSIDELVDDEIIDEERFDDDLHPIIVADDKFDEEIETYEDEVESFDGGKITDGLEVKKIRVGRHEDYVRLVFDIYEEGVAAMAVGDYKAHYNKAKNDIEVLLNGYRKFSASLPSFGVSSPIEQIYFENYRDDSAYKFHIKLRGESKVRIFDLENPARLVIDIKPI